MDTPWPPRSHLRLFLGAPISVAEQPIRAGGRVRAQPVADVDGQHDTTVVATRNRLGGNNIAELADVDQTAIKAVVKRAMTTPMLHGQRQLRQGHHRPVGAQRRITQLEQGIRPRGQTAIKLLPETSQLPDCIGWTVIMHSSRSPCVDLLPSQEA
jgi:hypothetical protein